LIWFHDAAGKSNLSEASRDAMRDATRDATPEATRDATRIELYNLAQDVGEERDLAAEADFVSPRSMLMEALSRALADSNAQLSIERATRHPISPPVSPRATPPVSPPAARARPAPLTPNPTPEKSTEHTKCGMRSLAQTPAPLHFRHGGK